MRGGEKKPFFLPTGGRERVEERVRRERDTHEDYETFVASRESREGRGPTHGEATRGDGHGWRAHESGG